MFCRRGGRTNRRRVGTAGRSSPGAPVPPAYSPLNEGTAVLWVDMQDSTQRVVASDIATTVRNKISGVAHTTGQMPVYSPAGLDGFPALQFEGGGSGTSANYIEGNEAAVLSALSNSSPNTLIFYVNGSVDQVDYWFSVANSAQAVGYRKAWGMSNVGLGRLSVQTINDAGATIITTASADFDHGTHVVAYVNDGSTQTIYVDGSAITTTSSAHAPGTVTPDRYALGCLNTPTRASFAKVRFAEVLIYAQALTAAAIGRITSNMVARRVFHVSDVGATLSPVIAYDAYAGQETNSVGINQFGVTTIEDPARPGQLVQVTRYARATARTIVMAKRDLPGGAWTTLDGLSTIIAADPHFTHAIAFDGSAHLFHSYSTHAHPIKTWRSAGPLAIDVGTAVQAEARIPLVAGNDAIESVHTYPCFSRRLPDGDLLYVWRTGGSGDGSQVLYRIESGTDNWSQVQNPLVDGSASGRSFYPDRLLLDATGVLHMSGCWRGSASAATNYDKMYARSNDFGATWRDKAGNVIAMPLTEANLPKARVIAQNTGLINSQALAADAAGNPVMVYYMADGTSKFWATHGTLGDNTWTSDLLWTDNGAFTWVDTPGATLGVIPPVTRPSAVVIGDYLLVFYTSRFQGPGLWVAACEKQAGHYVLVDQSRITTFDLAASEPTFDEELFALDGRLHFYAQFCAYGSVSSIASPVFIVEWDPTAYLASL